VAYDRKVGGHQVAHADRPDYRLLVGQAEVPVGAERAYAVLDPARATILEAWVASLIPASGSRPDASQVGAAQYIDATIAAVPALRPALLKAINRLEALAFARAKRPFTECPVAEREHLLRTLEAEDETDAFNMVRDFTYEAYYGHPDVLMALERETGWRGMAQSTGSPLPPFDDSLLDRIRALPARWRRTGQRDGVGR